MRARFLLAVAFASLSAAVRAQPLVVHEWGTFTSLQDEAGRTLSGINTDDEPVPPFCHDLAPRLVFTPGVAGWGPAQGAPRGHRDVTMRLETPVLYFHPPKNAPDPLVASVKVTFRGGWLTQFYPRALAGGFLDGSEEFENLSDETTGTLKWENLRIGGEQPGPKTTERVWTAPRAVDAATATTTGGESEKFLFYRGVGHLLCPLQMTRAARILEFRAQTSAPNDRLPPMTIRQLWLASFRPDGRCAFRSLPSCELPAMNGLNAERSVLFSTPAEFANSDYSPANLQKLRAQMHSALEEEGLFADEADALLNTWELSYFKSPGLRLFFMVPRAWTELHLPLELSVPAEIKRALVGRLELVTPEQRALLTQLAHAPTPTKPWVHAEVRHDWTALVGTPPPLYRELGRFRNALLLDEYAARPTESLRAFINLNQLWGYGHGPVQSSADLQSAVSPIGNRQSAVPYDAVHSNAPPPNSRAPMLSQRLATAAARGEVDMVASLLAEGVDPNARGYLNMTPLAALAFPGPLKDDKLAVQIAGLMLANGAQIDATDENGVTALYWAAESRKTNLVRFLLEKGAAPDVRMGRGMLKGRTPLHEAAGRDQLEIVQALVEFKAPLDAVDGEGSTPLALAEGNEHTEVARVLRRALQASGQAVPAERATPTREAMRAIAQRLANGDEAAYNDLSAAAQALYRGINYQSEAARVRMNLFKMKAAFDLLGEEAGKGNKIAMEALKRSLRDHSSHLASFAPDALGIAAAAGQEEALDILLRYHEWDILESTTVFAMEAPASANRERAVAFMISYLSDPQHRGSGMALSATEALKKAAARGNQEARDAVANYERANPQAN